MKSSKVLLIILLICFSIFGKHQQLLAQQLELNASAETETTNTQQGRFRLRISSFQGAFLATNKQGDTLPLEFSSQQNNSRFQRLGNQYFEDISLNLSRNERFNFDYSININEPLFTKPGIYRLSLDIDISALTTNELQEAGQSEKATLPQ